MNATTGHSEQEYGKLCKRLTALQLLFQLKHTDINPVIINGCGTSAYKLDYEEKGVTIHCHKTPRCTKLCLLGSARLGRVACSNRGF